jgi:hypothetical protein
LEPILSSALLPKLFFDSFADPEKQENQWNRSRRKQSPEDDEGPERKVFFPIKQKEKRGANGKVQGQSGTQARDILVEPDRRKQMGEKNIDQHDEGITPEKVNADTLFPSYQPEVGEYIG